MRTNRCAAHRCSCHQNLGRREFLAAASATSAAVLSGAWSPLGAETGAKLQPQGPAARCLPTIKACFVRRKGDYGMRWPGAIYDGEAARRKYTEQITATAKELNVKLDLQPEPIYNPQEAEAWIAEAVGARPDGLLVVLLDRQEHAWPTAGRALDTRIPTVVFAPIGAAFTTNTEEPSKKRGCFIASTDDFNQVRYGMKMLHAAAKLRATRCIVLAGNRAFDTVMPHLGIQLRYVPTKAFADEYQKTSESAEVLAMADGMMKGARRQAGATRQDVINGLKSYVVARTLLERHQGDAITMDCLGALGPTKISLPCIAWSKMNDDAIPAACEADLGAVASHCVVQYLFDRPGFQQDPVPETAKDAIIGAHCSCPTRLVGFGQAPEVYDIVHHHANRDATARPLWREGQRITSVDVLPGGVDQPTKMLVAAGTVLGNVAVPPSGGCVVSVMARFDDAKDVLAWPGFHQVFFYGDFKRELVQFCRLVNVEPVVV